MADILYLINLDGSNSSNSLIFSNELSGGSSSTESFVGEINGNTSEVKIKNRISSIVKYNLPEFIRTDYEKFVYFLEAYYKFLEQDYHSQEIIQNIKSYADIDKTASSFVYYFLQNYAKDLPLDTLSDKRFLIKRINDLYTSKGSSLSFDILFRVLFNTTVNIEHPYENVLVPSGGTWTQKSALGLKVISGDKTKIAGRFLTYIVNNARFETPILGYSDFASGDIEVSLDTSKLASRYVVGDSVYVYNALNELVFEGKILSTLVNNSVVQPGQGFRLGQIFNVNFASNTGVLVKVTKVSSTGGLEKLRIINYGYGYPDVLTVNLNKDTTSTSLKDAVTSSTRGTTDSVKVEKLVTELSNVMLKGNVTLSTTINRVDGFGDTEFVSNIRTGDSVTILSNVYTVQNVTSNTQFYITTVGLTNSANVKGFASDLSGTYFKEDYTTAPNNYTAASFVTTVNDNHYMVELPSTAVPADFASVVFTSGALARYPGSFTTNKGFVSESEIRLEDDLLYQPFAYQTNTEIDISKFYDIVISLIHPAGQRLFNNRSLNNFFDVSANVSELSAKVSNINFESYSTGKVSDSVSLTLTNSFGAIGEEDSATSTDLLTINSSLGTIQDLLDGIDETINTFAKTISDDVEATEFLVDLDYPTKPVFDNVDSPESNNILSINTTINDTAEPTDSGIFDFNPYAGEGFFSEQYTESITTF
jgi:hypothetical protein